MNEVHVFGGGMMWVFWILFIIGIALFIGYSMGRENNKQRKRTRTALETIEERYANGEIDREEFDQKKKDLVG